jgi:hypothetical protein
MFLLDVSFYYFFLLSFHSQGFNDLSVLLCSLIEFLSESAYYDGLLRRSGYVPLSHNLEFIKGYPVKTIAELNSDPELGTFIVNARMIDVLHLDPWWYPVCECREIFTKYLGAYHCTKCRVKKIIVAPKYVYVQLINMVLNWFLVFIIIRCNCYLFVWPYI